MRKPFILILLLLVSCTSIAPKQATNIPTDSPTLASVLHPNEPVSARTETPQTTSQEPIGITKLPTTANPKLTAIHTSTPSPQSTNALPNDHQLTQYKITAAFDYAAHHLSVDEHIVYTNTSPETLLALTLVIDPNRYRNSFSLKNLTWDDGATISPYILERGSLTFLLKKPLQPGQSVSLSLVYELQLPSFSAEDIHPHPFGYSDLQTNVGDWYPFIPPYSPGRGWLVHEPGAFGEHLVYDIANFDVTIQLVGNTKDLVIAASAGAEEDGDVYHFHLAAARTFSWSASPHYQLLTETVNTPNRNTITVQSYFFPAYDKAGKSALKTTSEALVLYSLLFGLNYPYTTMSIVQADFLDGMEYSGLYFLSKDFYNWHNGTPADYLVALAAHETAHQWWYGLVGNDQALEPWLDEALCTYSEHLFYENLYPDAMEWWWTYRVKYYQPDGWVNATIYDSSNDKSAYRSYRDTVYLNGALFLDELRNLIGDQDFFAFLQSYLATYKGRQASAEVFFALLETHTDMEIQDLLENYFR